MLQVNSISFSYQKSLTIDTVSFSVKKGNTIGIIGESGCGKSTLLKLIYGLYDIDKGEIFWNETQITGPKNNLIPGMPFMKYLAQDFDLMPFTTVAENVGSFLSNINKTEKNNRINELLEVVEMSEFAKTKVKFLSGGQMQRVAIAKALAQEPEVLLLDEPFSHIDNFRKNNLRRFLFSYLKKKKITTIIASHEKDDILSFTDKILVMDKGKMIQFDETKKVYSEKKNNYIASLFDEVSEIEINNKTILAYPHQLKIVEKSEIKTKVINSYFKGNHYLVESIFNKKTIFFISKNQIQANEIVFLEYNPEFSTSKK